MKQLLLFVIAAVVLSGCNEVVITPRQIVPLYRSLADYPSYSAKQRDSLIHADSLEIAIMMDYLGNKFVWEREDADKTDSLTPHADKYASRHKDEHRHDVVSDSLDYPTVDKLLMEWADSRTVRLYTPAVDSVYPTITPLENTLGLILANAQDYSLDIPDRHYAAVVWNSKKSIILTDSVVFIALNHFLGADFVGYRSAFYEYEIKDKTPEQLPYAIAEALVGSRYPYEITENSTALSRMMYEGAMVYIKLHLVPDATLASTLGYTTKELEWLDIHYKQMWEAVIGKDIIYSTSPEMADRLVGPAPNTSVISSDYPGRAGRYLGYRLIFNYMKNNAKTPLARLLSPSFYNDPSELVLAQ